MGTKANKGKRGREEVTGETTANKEKQGGTSGKGDNKGEQR